MIVKEINNKIKIITNINKLTNTLSMISLSKMNKYTSLLINLNIINVEFKKILEYIFKNIKTNKFCLIVITSNKGLCGNLNNEIIKYTLNYIKNNKNLDLILIGKKGIDFFDKKNIFIKKKIIFKDNELFKNILFCDEIFNCFKKYENIFFISSKIIKNNIKIVKTDLYIKKKYNYIIKHNFNYEIFLKNFYNYNLKYLYINNLFCELKSRMLTMKSAADNSKKLIKDMKLIKNKIRQFKITQEMLEIINGSNL
ncbi:F0F1 ATP synthase subunit gamma [Candidatus Carsonella ruddii]|uniref:ATP synthase gamma subunit n=2 Tax=Carsonella ruddii TaxID=114186 RepID=Q93U86_CARRU|nr:F0F1 ATP synthase subunit gamma [Candidatus Carsonella ruddii]AAK55908.1 ATP synthase gamma subunit [Candidatus Carsonella ruddii]AFP84235.1 F0F1-type ATP synthase gamma subunit [Candidatus Carsonella ruddii PC isolate NHV]